jgi:xyloglucan-specific endo-beta-1,4-glucanase
MVWLANFEAGPISTSLTIDGTPIPITGNISLVGHDWYSSLPYTEGCEILKPILLPRDLYDKINGTNHIYSFLPSDHAPITSFEGDLYTFLEANISSPI